MSNYSEDQALLVKLINADCFKDYYTILGVDKNRTSPEEIRKAYKKLCLRIHPDKNKAPGADEAFKKIDNAYRAVISMLVGGVFVFVIFVGLCHQPIRHTY